MSVSHHPTGLADPPRAVRRGRLVGLSTLVGVLLAVFWSFELVDGVIGQNVADTLLGHDAEADAIVGPVGGMVFAFVSGLAGTVTACNVAMLASVGPMSDAAERRATGVGALLRPIGLLALGMVVVSAAYGVIGVLLGDALPQLSTDTIGTMPVRLVQASVVFGVIGLAFVYLGLAVLGVVPDPFAARPAARVVALGALVGGFLIGRPYPLFNKLFHWAVDSGNPLYGAGAFVLQSLGNIAVVSVLFAVIVLVTRGGFVRWLSGNPVRALAVSGSLLLALGVFTVVYWVVRIPARFGFGWFPAVPYN